ncbi:thioredoxin domain-containing protein [Nakamurella leprariae]|uniref:Thioredoxin domain-containing protein n=1 Tax=Nakamurella leprariae TaxID=2803911 RepID=A0A938Y7F2_9ACTN|nr:thioredoxin domain-containing protein [Nakamurella leprariae]MBM9467205.1 thioredoxin domain-containing protein [Nakamurella leprariae]
MSRREDHVAKSSQPPSGQQPGDPDPADGPDGAQPGRVSVAAERSGRNRTQGIVLLVVVIVMVVVIVVGVFLYRSGTQVQNDGYGRATTTTATVQDGAITVAAPGAAGNPDVPVLDVYEDGLCPICADFEEQYGQQLAQALDEGRVVVRYHLLTFMDGQSASGSYSTRAAAAMTCVAEEAGAEPGVFDTFHAALFADDTQPDEGGATDLTDRQLADLASGAGAGAAADCITSGSQVPAASAAAESGRVALQAATQRVATPTVLRDGQDVPWYNSTSWLPDLLG